MWKVGAPLQIRTGNLLVLNQTPLPVGLEGHAVPAGCHTPGHGITVYPDGGHPIQCLDMFSHGNCDPLERSELPTLLSVAARSS